MDFSPFCKRLKMTKAVWIFLLRLRLATRWVANAQNDRTLVISTCFCHTEALAEVSIKLKCVLNFVDFSPFCKRLKMTEHFTKIKRIL